MLVLAQIIYVKRKNYGPKYLLTSLKVSIFSMFLTETWKNSFYQVSSYNIKVFVKPCHLFFNYNPLPLLQRKSRLVTEIVVIYTYNHLPSVIPFLNA